jgi:hypothetical protein
VIAVSDETNQLISLSASCYPRASRRRPSIV